MTPYATRIRPPASPAAFWWIAGINAIAGFVLFRWRSRAAKAWVPIAVSAAAACATLFTIALLIEVDR